jgi:hypothetical protein
MKRYGLMVTCALATAGLLGFLVHACAAGDMEAYSYDGGDYDAGGGYDAGPQPECQTDQDCGPGLSCRNGRCVSIPDAGGGVDAGPPEDEHMEFQPPVGSENYVFVVNTTLGTVAKIDPGALSNIEVSSIPVGSHPTILYTIPGSDTAVVLNEGSHSVSVIVASPEEDLVHEVDVGQPYTAMSMSPDGAYVVVYFDQSDAGTDPSTSANKVAIVDINSVFAGDPRVYEYAVGYRVTDVIFDHLSGPQGPFSSKALIVSKADIAIADLDRLDSVWILPRVWIENPDAEVVRAREVLATPDVRHLIFRNFNTTELTVVDIEEETSTRLMLHGLPTDLDLSPDGRRALVVQRAEGIVTRLDLDADLRDGVLVDGVRYFDPDGDGTPSPDDLVHVVASDPYGQPLAVGQSEMYTVGGRLKAMLYTNQDDKEEISIMDVDSMSIDYLGRLINKLVDYVVLSPGGRAALVVHRPQPGSIQTDPVEREIDALHGYTLIDLATHATFQQVTEATLGPLSFSSTGRHAILTVFDEGLQVNELHVLDLYRLTLQMDSVPLEALPQFVGVLPGGEIGYVAQEHRYGKITFVDMTTMAKRAVTGYELNAE